MGETGGEVTGFVSAVGTGGTLAGTSRFLKERNPRIVSAAPIRMARRCGRGLSMET